MDEKLIQEFIQWLPQNIEEFANKSREEIIATINELSKSDVETLQQLMTAFQQSKSSNLFKRGGKLEAAVNKFQQGGLTRRQALTNYMMNNDGTTRSQARQAYRNAKWVGQSNVFHDTTKQNNYRNHRDWARRQGLKTFRWKGGLYGTKLADEVEAPAQQPVAQPVANPDYPRMLTRNGHEVSVHPDYNYDGVGRSNMVFQNGGTKPISTSRQTNTTATHQNPDYQIDLLQRYSSVHPDYYGGLGRSNMASQNGDVKPISISRQTNMTDIHQNPDAQIVLTSNGLVSTQPDYAITTTTSRSGTSRVPVTFPMRGGQGRYSMALQDGGKFNSLNWPKDFTQRRTERGSEYYISNADTLDNTVRRVVKRPINGGWATTEQYQTVGDPSNTYYKWYRNVNPDESDGYPLGIISRPKKFFDTNRADRERLDKIFKDLYNY